MKKDTLKIITTIIIVILLAIIILLFNTTNKKTKEEPQEEPFIETKVNVDNTTFDYNFLKLENNNQNKVYSPLSIKYALSMLNEGANGNTKVELDNVLQNIKFNKYNNIEDVLSLANGIYIRDNYKEYVKKDYIDILNNKYNAEIKYDAFNNATNVNNWIEDKTFGIIKNMLKDESVTKEETKMILINALAIDMSWAEEFETNNTHGQNFNLENGTTIKTTMMNQETSSDKISYYKDDNITSLKMDLKSYDDTTLEFIAIIPKTKLSDYINTFTIEDIDNIIKNQKNASQTNYGLDISIPKFSFEYDLNLKNDLIKLGIKDAFDKDKANFTNMTNDPDGLYVNEALHKANIDFTEKGVKAAAVTVIAMNSTTSIEENKPENITFDQPFMYIIRDKQTGEVWFVGTVYEPNLWENDSSDYQ